MDGPAAAAPPPRPPDAFADDFSLLSPAPGGGSPEALVPFPADFVVDGAWCTVPPYETTKVVNVKERWRERPLAEVLAAEFKLTATYVEEATAARRLLVNKSACGPDAVLFNGDQITHTFTVAEPQIRSEPVAILAENEHLVVAEKPAGLPCHPQGSFQRASLTELLRCAHLGDREAYLHPVNRLDRETSGVVLLAKTRKAYMLLSRELGCMRKLYVARVRGVFSLQAAISAAARLPQTQVVRRDNSAKDSELGARDWQVKCDLPLTVEKHRPDQPLTVVVDVDGGKASSTSFRLLHGGGRLGEEEEESSLVLCRPVTGRTHQIRVHLAALGFPIIGDLVYGNASPLPNAAEGSSAEIRAELMCLRAAVYAVPVDGRQEAGLAARELLPRQQPDASELPGHVVYRCRGRPSWFE